MLYDTDDCSCYCYSFPTTGLTTQGKDNINYVALYVLRGGQTAFSEQAAQHSLAELSAAPARLLAQLPLHTCLLSCPCTPSCSAAPPCTLAQQRCARGQGPSRWLKPNPSHCSCCEIPRSQPNKLNHGRRVPLAPSRQPVPKLRPLTEPMNMATVTQLPFKRRRHLCIATRRSP